MKCSPILFAAPMVRAILEGRKTQTRRVVIWPVRSKPGVPGVTRLFLESEVKTLNKLLEKPGKHWSQQPSQRFGKRGDRLWVKETWLPDAPRDGTWADVEFYGCKNAPLDLIPERYRKPKHCLYRASSTVDLVGWRPSIHMPRWASRITLEVIGVRVEQLRYISEADAIAEGYAETADSAGGCFERTTARENFLNGDWARTLEDNPWVWVVEFQRVKAGA